MNKTNNIPDFAKMAKQLIKNAARYAGGESVKFFRESFVRQGFLNKSLTPWRKTTNPLAGKRTLYNTGTLMSSIRKTKGTTKQVVVESATNYSEIHNEGGEIIVTEKMKRFFWAKYCEISGIKKNNVGKTVWKDQTNIKKKKDGTMSQAKANLRTNAKAEFCKAMALKPVGSKIKIDRRQFMGHSDTMMKQFEAFFQGEIEIQFKQHLNND